MKLLKQINLFWVIVFLIVFALWMVIFSSVATAAEKKTATLKWDAVANTTTCIIKGYNIYWGKVKGSYTGNIDVGNVTKVPNLKAFCKLRGKTQYFFVVSAYSSDNEGEVSESANYVTEVGYTAPPDVIPIETTVPTKVTITIAITEVE